MPANLKPRRLAALAVLVAATLCLGYALPLRAQESGPAHAPQAPAPATDPADEPGQTRFAPTRRGAATAFAASLRTSEQAHAAALADLRAELELAPRSDRAALQRRIEALKLTREARLVALQLGEAQRKGNTPLAAKLTRRLSKMSAAGVTMPVSPVGGER